MEVRPATNGELPAVATVLDAAMLSTGDLRERVAADDVLVAVDDGPVVGALVLAPPADTPAWARDRETDAHVLAVAVRRRRRDQGLGSALVEAAGDGGRLTASFDPDVRPFYEALGFAVQEGPDGRLRGMRDPRR
jgi:predicted N-acetyltransferase YhbS